MKNSIISILSTLIAFTILVSCEENEPTTQLDVPSTYEFTNSEGTSTVSYSGQSTRLAQLEEITAYLKSANTPGTALDAAQIKEMYSNNDGEGSSYFTSDLASTAGKDLMSKTGRGEPVIQNQFMAYMDSIASISAQTESGQFVEPGQAGVLQNAGGTKAYLVSNRGVEYTQLIEKGLMGAVFMDQIQNNYLTDGDLNVENDQTVEGKPYTLMEHHWDEAYGYFTTSTDFLNEDSKRFWGKYSNGRDPLLGCNQTLFDAYLRGRAAIVAEMYDIRDAERDVIRETLTDVCAATAIHYLNDANGNFADAAIRCHALSEAAAFIEGLYYTHNGPARAEIETVLDYLKTDGEYDFYQISDTDIIAARDELASITELEEMKGQF